MSPAVVFVLFAFFKAELFSFKQFLCVFSDSYSMFFPFEQL